MERFIQLHGQLQTAIDKYASSDPDKVAVANAIQYLLQIRLIVAVLGEVKKTSDFFESPYANLSEALECMFYLESKLKVRQSNYFHSFFKLNVRVT